jgi:hypothetical protein
MQPNRYTSRWLRTALEKCEIRDEAIKDFEDMQSVSDEVSSTAVSNHYPHEASE